MLRASRPYPRARRAAPPSRPPTRTPRPPSCARSPRNPPIPPPRSHAPAAGSRSPPRPPGLRAPGGPRAPAAPPAPVAPPRPAAPPTAPPRPRAEPPAAPPPPTDAPRSFRDTAAFHLANSASLWDEPAARTSPARPRRRPPPPRPPRRPASTGPGRPTRPALAGNSRRPTGVEPVPRRSLAERLPSTRIVAAAVSLVLGIGLMGGAAAGSWLTESPAKGTPTPEAAFAKGQDAWRNTPVDTLFPRTVEGLAAGPGGADRTWIRIAVAPDADCTAAAEGPLAKELAPAGCARLLRATYVDATRTDVITVGAQTTKADRSGMMDLNARFSTHNLATRTALMPLPLAARGTPAEGFGPAQRASWTVRILTDIPVVVYAVSGFADGREVTDPQPADAAVQPGTATAPAESGLGHDAKGLADKVTATFRAASGIPASPTEEAP
ncbi:hypothetical protein [Streptomyces noursei]|uniref:hypothetical protein n=1 Tax=Streptomyces noursei TaxID=1971 RepID=UPI00045EE082|nr:hypothetical protein [Streptomyces noursei]AIA02587.1 hypothetical protein DC74_2077 [Streptomyces noursei]